MPNTQVRGLSVLIETGQSNYSYTKAHASDVQGVRRKWQGKIQNELLKFLSVKLGLV